MLSPLIVTSSAYRLALDPNRHLILGPSHGPVEFHWLRHAWMDARSTGQRSRCSLVMIRPSHFLF